MLTIHRYGVVSYLKSGVLGIILCGVLGVGFTLSAAIRDSAIQDARNANDIVQVRGAVETADVDHGLDVLPQIDREGDSRGDDYASDPAFNRYVWVSVAAPRSGDHASSALGQSQRLLPWGAFYIPVSEAARNGITGMITDTSMDTMGWVLSEARAGNVKVIVTLGSVGDCEYYLSPTVFDFERALRDKSDDLSTLISAVGGYEQLASYVNDGTLVAIRVFDEVHYARPCGRGNGIEYQLSWCNGGRQLKGLPVGTDNEPGFADLLHELKKRLPDNLPIGSTSQPSYMGHVAARIDTLRRRDGLAPLPQNSILAHSGYSREDDYPRQTARQKLECDAVGFPNSDLIFFLGNHSCNDDANNFTWWSDYIDGCQAANLDFYASWSWDSGAAGTFESRLQDLLDGGVSSEGATITLETVRQTCSRLIQ